MPKKRTSALPLHAEIVWLRALVDDLREKRNVEICNTDEARAEITRLRAINAELVEGLKLCLTAIDGATWVGNAEAMVDAQSRARELLKKVEGKPAFNSNAFVDNRCESCGGHHGLRGCPND